MAGFNPSIILPPSGQLFEAVGSVIVYWAFFEAELDCFEEGLWAHPEVKIKHKRIPWKFSDRQDFWRQSAEIIFSSQSPELVTRIKRIADDTTEPNYLRNFLAHGKIAVDGQTSNISLAKRNKEGWESIEVNIEKLLTTASTICSLAREIMALHTLHDDFLVQLSATEIQTLRQYNETYVYSAPPYSPEAIKPHHKKLIDHGVVVDEGLADIKAGRTIPHEKIREWLLSWGTDHELPPPKAG